MGLISATKVIKFKIRLARDNLKNMILDFSKILM